MMLNVAAGLLVVLALAHSYLGERYILIRLFKRGNLPKVLGGTEFTQHTLRYIWHLITALALGMALLLVQLGGGATGELLAVTLGWTAIAAGVLALVQARGRHLSWVVLLAAGALCLAWAFN